MTTMSHVYTSMTMRMVMSVSRGHRLARSPSLSTCIYLSDVSTTQSLRITNAIVSMHRCRRTMKSRARLRDSFSPPASPPSLIHCVWTVNLPPHPPPWWRRRRLQDTEKVETRSSLLTHYEYTAPDNKQKVKRTARIIDKI